MADEKKVADEKKAATKTYKVKHPVRHNKKHYERGSKIVLEADDAKPLLDSGHIEE